MGYYTRYTLTVTAHEPSLRDEYSETIIAAARREFEFLDYAVDIRGLTSQETKWYDWGTDMVAVSSRYPGWLFRLDGVGEDTGDSWTAYFLNGKSQIERQPPWDPPPCRLGGTK